MNKKNNKKKYKLNRKYDIKTVYLHSSDNSDLERASRVIDNSLHIDYNF